MKKGWVLTVVVLLSFVLFLAGCGKTKKSNNIVLDKIVITPQYTASLPGDPLTLTTQVYRPPVDTLSQIYAQAYFLSAADLEGIYACDPDIVVTRTAEGINFTSLVKYDVPSNQRNRFVKLAYKNNAGIIDLTALQVGKIGIDVLADIDLSNTTNGIWAKLLRGTTVVSDSNAQVRGDIPEPKALSDLIFHTTINESKDQVYIELTIPWQGSITVKGIYLYFQEFGVTGFSDMDKKITGGTGDSTENTYTVTNAQEFYQALTSVKAANNAPSIIHVNGKISYDEYQTVSGSTRRDIDINVKNLSIIGVGTNGEFDGIGLKVSGQNIIIQNLTIHHVLGADGIQINNAKYVKVDHCTLYNDPIIENPSEELKDKYDELISLKNQTEYVILSWNELYDSYKTILVGSNDDEDALPDRKLIMHHNYIHDCGSRLPLYRGGHGHIYNNYYLNNDSAINCRTGSKLLIEHNYFENCKHAIGYWFDTGNNPSGKWQVKNNKFVNCQSDTPEYSTCEINFGSDYNYDLDDVDDVPGIVVAGAGVGKIQE